MDRTQAIKEINHNIAETRAILGRAGDTAVAPTVDYYKDEELDEFRHATEQMLNAAKELGKGTDCAKDRQAGLVPKEERVA